MKLIPNYQLQILPEADFSRQMEVVAAELEKCRKEGTFSGFDGESLYYEYYQAQGSKGAVVVLHGLSEFTAKYHEFAWYLLNQGYDVFLYDQRSHGRSCRLTPRQDMIHVDCFFHYRKDLACFLEQVVKPVTDLPLYLYAHSMGGATAIDFLAENPEVFRKAVLSAPMIEPLTGSVPPIVARWGLTIYTFLGNGKKKFWLSKEFAPEYPFSRSNDKSEARFNWNMQIRLANPCYCTTPQTLRWVQQSLRLRGRLTRKNYLKKIRTPIRMLCAQEEKVVCEKAQEEFAKNCPTCQKMTVAEATHGILWGTETAITECVKQVLDHFR